MKKMTKIEIGKSVLRHYDNLFPDKCKLSGAIFKSSTVPDDKFFDHLKSWRPISNLIDDLECIFLGLNYHGHTVVVQDEPKRVLFIGIAEPILDQMFSDDIGLLLESSIGGNPHWEGQDCKFHLMSDGMVSAEGPSFEVIKQVGESLFK